MVLNEITIYLASPSDLEDERDVAVKVVGELNRALARSLGLVLRLLRYEDDAVPGIGVDPQDVVNQSMGGDYDILVGIFWTRFGSPTRRAPSGTYEEIDAAVERFMENPDQVRVMLYFKTANVSPDVDLGQLKRVQDYKRRLSDISNEYTALYSTFSDVEEFEDQLRIHLTKQLLDWGKTWGPQSEEAAETKQIEQPEEDEEPADLEEEGLFDLLDTAEDQIHVSNDSIGNMTDAMEVMSQSLAARTEDLNIESSKEKINRNRVRRIVGLAARDMESFVGRVETELPIQREAFGTAIEAYERMVLLITTDFQQKNGEAEDNLDEILEGIVPLFQSIGTAIESIETMYNAVEGLPRITKEWNRARRNLLDSLNKLSEAFGQEKKVVGGLISTVRSAKSHASAGTPRGHGEKSEAGSAAEPDTTGHSE